MKCKVKHKWAATTNVLNAQINPRNGTNMVAHKHSNLRPKLNAQHTHLQHMYVSNPSDF